MHQNYLGELDKNADSWPTRRNSDSIGLGMCPGNLHFNKISWDFVAEFWMSVHKAYGLPISRIPLGWEAGAWILVLSGW